MHMTRFLRGSSLTAIFTLSVFSALQAQAVVWTRIIADSSQQELRSFHMDSQGDLVLAGEYATYPIESGIGTKAFGEKDIFIHKMDRTGKTKWFRHFGAKVNIPTLADLRVDLDIDPLGRIYILGEFSNGAERDAGLRCFFTSKPGDTVFTSLDGGEQFVAQYAPDGTLNWMRQFNRGGHDTPSWSIQANASGFTIRGVNVKTVGFQGQADSVSSNGFGFFWAGGNADGNGLWVREAAPDGNGSYEFAGTVREFADGTRYLDSAGKKEKWNPMGRLAWSRRIPLAGAFYATDFLPDGKGGVYVYGVLTDSARFRLRSGRDTLVVPEKVPGEPWKVARTVARLDDSGNMQWVRAVPCKTHPDQNVNRAVLGPDGVISFVDQNLGMNRIDSTGKLLQTSPLSGTIFVGGGYGVTQDPEGNLYVAASYFEDLGLTFLGEHFPPFPQPGARSNLMVMKIDPSKLPEFIGRQYRMRMAPLRPGMGSLRIFDGLGRDLKPDMHNLYPLVPLRE